MIFINLLDIAGEIQTWTALMIMAQSMSIVMYVYSMFILRQQFDVTFVFSIHFIWPVALIVTLAWFPILIIKVRHFYKRN